MLTINEWAKLNPTPLQSGVVEIFAKENPVLATMPFQNIAGSAYRYNIESELPGIAFRGFNEGYTESTGVINPAVESLAIMGGNSDLDIAQVAMGTGDNDTRSVYDRMKAKAAARLWLTKFFWGNATANPKEFDALDRRVTGNQVLMAADWSSGSAKVGTDLTLEMLDQLLDNVTG